MLLTTPPAPLDGLDWAFLSGLLGLMLIGVGGMGLRSMSDDEADDDPYGRG